VLGGSHVWIGDYAGIDSQSLLASVVNTGAGGTLIGIGAKPGPVTSQSWIKLLTGARIDGRAVSGSHVFVYPGAQATEGVLEHQDLGDYDEVAFSADFTPRLAPSFTVYSGQTRTLTPGRYGKVFVYPFATLSIVPGEYRVDSFTVSLGAGLNVGSGGLATVYARDSAFLGGVVQGTDAARRLLVAAAGTSTVEVAGSFKGTVVAPRASVLVKPALPSPHQGAFIGHQVTLAATARIEHVPFDWSGFLPPAPVELSEAPIDLRASLHADGTDEPGQDDVGGAVTFTIPEFLRVTVGNAGNGTAELAYTDADGTRVTCTYEGRGSPIPVPDPRHATVEWTRGLRYWFVGCDNGLVAGDRTTGTDFSLRIVSGDPLGVVLRVETFLGDGCSEPLEDPFPPEESIELMHDFDWTETAAVPETDPDGHPSLYYAWIYMENDWQIEALNTLGVHWDPQGIFSPHFQKYEGQCGPLDYAGDGFGLFVHAVLPGALYNLIRAKGVDVTLNGGSMPFRAIILPDRPDAGSTSMS
jgi:hypothetical protein